MEYKAVGTLSKKLYKEYEEYLNSKYKKDDVDDILKKLRDILLFDPDKSNYTKEKGKQMVEWRKKKSEETGLSLYIINGGKQNYEKRKVLKNNIISI